jgi:hypothetical protein
MVMKPAGSLRSWRELSSLIASPKSSSGSVSRVSPSL